MKRVIKETWMDRSIVTVNLINPENVYVAIGTNCGNGTFGKWILHYDNYITERGFERKGYFFKKTDVRGWCGLNGYHDSVKECIEKALEVDGMTVYEFDSYNEAFEFILWDK